MNDTNKWQPGSDAYRRMVRAGGLLYFVLIACGIFAEIFVLSPLIVPGNAVATKKNILAGEMLFRSGIVAHLLTLVCTAFLLGIFFMIFRKTAALLANWLLIFNLAAIAVESVTLLYEFETMMLLKSRVMAAVFTPEQIAAVAYIPLQIQSAGYDLALVFFGIVCCLVSILIVRSKQFPAWIGILMFIAGICYIINSLVSFMAPAWRQHVLPGILIPCFIAELSLSMYMMLGKLKRVPTQ